ncbi:hypothetical protein J7J47_09420 [Halomonas sp. ISL-60]|uniref:hypothetical protein n=1 Tax=Halomonas sp. ISL-56 TaxID=2819149 RepID=UPI001BEBC984|nr:hypothetical protein [Halomonas sp. ISL-56]MBT2772453.1 hypothetical protein [Halomonas sp. ISL-60]MBT2803366.1 hypothetical protein [Halomonas sp. ISL-56]
MYSHVSSGDFQPSSKCLSLHSLFITLNFVLSTPNRVPPCLGVARSALWMSALSPFVNSLAVLKTFSVDISSMPLNDAKPSVGDVGQ